MINPRPMAELPTATHRYDNGSGTNKNTRRARLRRRMGMHIYVLPNLVTTANMFFGFFAIIVQTPVA